MIMWLNNNAINGVAMNYMEQQYGKCKKNPKSLNDARFLLKLPSGPASNEKTGGEVAAVG